MNAIEVTNLTKRYGNLNAVNNINFNIEAGKIVGIVGANGAGKTTMLEMMVGIRKPTIGNIRLMDTDIHENEYVAKNKIGVLLQEQCVNKYAKVIELFNFYHDLYENPIDVEEMLDTVNLQDYRNVKFKNLSGGLKQRAALGLAMINNPDILFLDEPTTGLDPEARRTLWKAIFKFKSDNKTVVLSSHYMDEVQKYCDEVIIMKKGEIIQKNTPEALIKSVGDNKFMDDAYLYYAVGEEVG
ncbi:MAG: ABC transporter ATP-binding protein [Pseudobutyrivibrio sp.]|nr:ABC transporter ATP-binding protein [Pseudobutyrivibrio sp.]